MPVDPPRAATSTPAAPALTSVETLPRLTLYHLLTLALIAAFSIGSYLVLSRVTLETVGSSTLLIVAQQRVTAQQIATHAALLLAETDAARISRQQAIIAQLAAEFDRLHAEACDDDNDHAALTPGQRAIYFNPPYVLDTLSHALSDRAAALAALDPAAVPSAAVPIEALITAVSPVETGLNRLMSQIRDERRQAIGGLVDLQLLLMIATLIVLVGVGVVILWPLQCRVRGAIDLLLREITTRREAQAALAASEDRYRALVEQLEQGRALMMMILDHSPDAVFVVDRESRFLLVNAAEARLMGLANPADAVGKTVRDIYPPERAELYYANEQRVMAEGRIVTDKLDHVVDEQGERWFSVAKVPLRTADGAVIGMLGLSRDITARTLAERQRLALDRERDKVEILADLMRNTSHELRNPLSLINTSLYLLRRTDDPARREERIDAVEGQVKYLTSLLEQMHNLGALDQAGDFTLAEANLHDLIAETTHGFQELVAQQGKTLTVRLHECIPLVQINERQFKFALRHLLENALTFTEPGGTITVQTRCEGRTGEAGAILEVIDDGIGIAPEHLAHIFDRFYKADPARPLDKGGAGLGLSIVRRIISIHQGTITAESTPGQGSLFRICLPLTGGTCVQILPLDDIS